MGWRFEFKMMPTREQHVAIFDAVKLWRDIIEWAHKEMQKHYWAELKVDEAIEKTVADFEVHPLWRYIGAKADARKTRPEDLGLFVPYYLRTNLRYLHQQAARRGTQKFWDEVWPTKPKLCDWPYGPYEKTWRLLGDDPERGYVNAIELFRFHGDEDIGPVKLRCPKCEKPKCDGTCKGTPPWKYSPKRTFLRIKPYGGHGRKGLAAAIYKAG